ncbi:hypothetical protein CEXT_659451 [Caerostris extrusa]|uniref:Uncharacterized protein n=1 Tax=Caerostris extrusa TaxID=172846 RepID=A0AAV4M5W5_CAEEX|nr:hypothetical protein CEXT_659451 [Caerostris extrusa]
MGAASGSSLADECLGKDVSLLRDRPPLLRLSYGPIRNGEQLSDGLITSALDFIMDFIRAPGERSSSHEPSSEKGFVSRAFPHAPMLKEIDLR